MDVLRGAAPTPEAHIALHAAHIVQGLCDSGTSQMHGEKERIQAVLDAIDHYMVAAKHAVEAKQLYLLGMITNHVWNSSLCLSDNRVTAA